MQRFSPFCALTLMAATLLIANCQYKRGPAPITGPTDPAGAIAPTGPTTGARSSGGGGDLAMPTPGAFSDEIETIINFQTLKYVFNLVEVRTRPSRYSPSDSNETPNPREVLFTGENNVFSIIDAMTAENWKTPTQLGIASCKNRQGVEHDLAVHDRAQKIICYNPTRLASRIPDRSLERELTKLMAHEIVHLAAANDDSDHALTNSIEYLTDDADPHQLVMNATDYSTSATGVATAAEEVLESASLLANQNWSLQNQTVVDLCQQIRSIESSIELRNFGLNDRLDEGERSGGLVLRSSENDRHDEINTLIAHLTHACTDEEVATWQPSWSGALEKIEQIKDHATFLKERAQAMRRRDFDSDDL